VPRVHLKVSTLLAAVALSWARPGHAEPGPLDPPPGPPSDVAAARALFTEGLTHADAGRWEAAADRFERARALRPSPAITYNLSTALVHKGQLVRASELLREVLAEPQVAPPVRNAANTRLGALLPRLAHLTVELPVASPSGLHVLIDQRPVDTARLGVPLPVDPAAHSLELRRGLARLDQKDVVLKEGERRTVRLGAADVAEAVAVDVVDVRAATEANATPPAPASSRAWIWAVAGAVAAGTATALVLATRDGGAPPAGNAGTWTLGR
jgi:hypothetical protein